MSHYHQHVANDLLRSQRDIAREQAATMLGDPPTTRCRLKLALGVKPKLRDKLADDGRKALRAHIILFVIAAAWFLAWSWWFLPPLLVWAVVLVTLWRKTPELYAAERERRAAAEPRTVVLPVQMPGGRRRTP